MPPGLLELNALPVALKSAVVELARPPGFSDVMAWVVTLPVTAVAEALNAEHRAKPTLAAEASSSTLQAEMRQGVTAVWMAACAVPHWQAWSLAPQPATEMALWRQVTCGG